MKREKPYYKLYSKYGLEGYYVPVRNTFSKNIEQEFIPLKAKDFFEKKFGDRIISDQEFLNWFTENAVNFE